MSKLMAHVRSWMRRFRHRRPASVPIEGIRSLLVNFVHTGAIRVETEASVDGSRLLCFVSTIHLDGQWLLEIHQRAIDRYDLFGLHRHQVTLQLQSLRRWNRRIAVLPWGATLAAAGVGFYTAPGKWLTISAYSLLGLVVMTMVRGMAGRITGWIIRLSRGLISKVYGEPPQSPSSLMTSVIRAAGTTSK
jgi:hypothetical protein